MEQLEYWKKRCELAEMYIEESPCDPDITMNQLAAYSAWNHFKNSTNPVVVDCKHDNEIMTQSDGFVYSTCGDCGDEL